MYRTILVPRKKVVIISGQDKKTGLISKETFKFDLNFNYFEKCQNMKNGRIGMACHYDYGEKYIYALGGCLRQKTTVRVCEKFDI